MEHSTMDDSYYFADIQIQAIDSPQDETQDFKIGEDHCFDDNIEFHENTDGLTMGDIHTFDDTIELESLTSLQEPEKPIESLSAVDINCQVEPTAVIIQKQIASQSASDVDNQIVPKEYLREVTENPVASKHTSNCDHESERSIHQQEEKEKDVPNESKVKTLYYSRKRMKLDVLPRRSKRQQLLKEHSKTGNSHSFGDVETQIMELLQEDRQCSRMDDGHSLVDIQTQLSKPLQEEPEGPIVSQSSSDFNGLSEQTTSLIEEAEKSIASQSASDVNIHFVPKDLLQEISEEPIASQCANDTDLQIEHRIHQQEAEKQVACKPNSDSDLQSFENIDMTATFTTDTVFNSRAELIGWARDVGKTVGTTIVINKSDKSYPGKKPRIVIGCERGGKYRMNTQRGKPTRPAGSKRCGCPFLLKGIKMPKEDDWKITVACGFHNHPLTEICKGHSYAGKLTLQEKELVLEMAKGGAKPRDVLSALKERNVHNASKLRTIYNARKRMKDDELSRRSQMQQFLKKDSAVGDGQYIKDGVHIQPIELPQEVAVVDHLNELQVARREETETVTEVLSASDADLRILPIECSEKPISPQPTSDMDLQIEPRLQQEAEQAIRESTVGDGHSFEDDIQPKPKELLQEVPVKLTVSQSAKDLDHLNELNDARREEAEKVTDFLSACDANLRFMPIEPLTEVAEKPLSPQPTSDADLQIEPRVPQQESEKLVVSKPTSGADLQLSEHIDMTTTFTTDTIFNSRAELIEWARDMGKTVGTTIVINKSDKSYPGKKPRVIIGCERGGKYRMNSQRGKPARPAGSKRCGCPFLLKGVKMPNDDQWKVTVACGFHNHPITEDCKGHSYAGKLTLQEKEIVVEMAKGGAKPKDVLNALKERNVHNASKLKTIYNARKRMKVDELSRRSKMQQLLKKVAEHDYLKWHREEEGDSVSDLIWAHPASIKLAKCFPHVFLMDSTFKQNKYMPSVLEIVGVTSTNKTFTFAFVYVEAEKEESYVWALECIKAILNCGSLPSVFVTDKELCLMNAIKRVFPGARNLLCRYSISRDISTNCKKMFDRIETWNSFIFRWNDLVFSSTEEEYCDRLTAFGGDFSEYSGALLHVEETWLLKYRECFIAAWTDQSIHFGNTTITRPDNDLTRLKRHLWTSQGNFNTMWTAINSLLLLQHTEINASFNESLNTPVDDYSSMMFEELRGSISIIALDLILMEAKLADSVGPDSVGPEDHTCECVIRYTHGLPCSHEICRYKYEGRPIPLSCIHPHWKKLSSVPTMCPHYELYYEPELQMLCKIYEESDENVKAELLKKIKDIATSVDDCEPAS